MCFTYSGRSIRSFATPLHYNQNHVTTSHNHAFTQPPAEPQTVVGLHDSIQRAHAECHTNWEVCYMRGSTGLHVHCVVIQSLCSCAQALPAATHTHFVHVCRCYQQPHPLITDCLLAVCMCAHTHTDSHSPTHHRLLAVYRRTHTRYTYTDAHTQMYTSLAIKTSKHVRSIQML